MTTAPSPDLPGLEAAIGRFLAAFNALDWAVFRTMFTDDATIFYPRWRAPRATTSAESDAVWQTVFADIRAASVHTAPPYQDLQPRDRHLQWLGDVAILTFHLAGPGTGTGLMGRRTLVWRFTSDGWRIVHLHASAVPSPEADQT